MDDDGPGRLIKSAAEWRSILEPRVFGILFAEDTEAPWSSPLNAVHEAGTFICAGCHLPLFDAQAKFDSGTGWPSFYKPINPLHLGTRVDHRLAIARTEYHCARCGGHQGHVFRDGPPPTGLRYCNNGSSLLFVAEDEELPPWRD